VGLHVSQNFREEKPKRSAPGRTGPEAFSPCKKEDGLEKVCFSWALAPVITFVSGEKSMTSSRSSESR
jgi:hypothetical protein